MIYVGGLRSRLIRDSVWHTVDDALRALGWYESVTSRSPVRLTPEPIAQNSAITFNTLALGDEDNNPEPAELGSLLTEWSWDMHVDVYAENDDLSLHLIGDVAAALAGRLPSIGRSSPTVEVYDYTLATPAHIFTVQIESVTTDKARDFPQPWLRYWRTCSFVVVDAYGTEDDASDLEPVPVGYGSYSGGY